MMARQTNRWVLAAVAALAPAAHATEPPVRCVFDVSAVVAPERRPAVQHRLRAGLAGELAGGDGSFAALKLVAAFTGGHLRCGVFLQFGDEKRPPVDVTVATLAELADVADAKARSERMWMGRVGRRASPGAATAPAGQSRPRWTIQPLMPRAAACAFLTAPGRGGVWELHRRTRPGGVEYTIEMLRPPRGDPDVAGQVLVSRPVGRAAVALTVRNSNGAPLSGMQIHARADGFPDADAIKLMGRAPTCLTGDDGRARFDWEADRGAYVLIARHGVPLTWAFIAPAPGDDGVHRDEVRLGARVTLDGKAVDLETYCTRKANEYRKIAADRELVGRVTDRVKALLDAGKLDDAELEAGKLPLGNPARGRLLAIIGIARTTGRLELLRAKARLAAAQYDYDSAIRHLNDATAIASTDARPALAAEVKRLRALAAGLAADLAPHRRVLFETLPARKATEIADILDAVEGAVKSFCSAGTLSLLNEAYRKLDDAGKRISRARQDAIEAVKAGTMKETDPTLVRLRDAQERILKCGQQISIALGNAEQRINHLNMAPK